MFAKVLIANRGIIQVSCIRAVRELGAKAAVLYVADEKNGIGVRMADEAYELKTDNPGQEYYDEDAIVEIAAQIGADAVHPGYGFLSQNTRFAKKLADRGICLISSDMNQDRLGIADKPGIKAFAVEARVPVIQGSDACHSFADVQKAAKQLGYPLIMKAVGGYGGLAIRVVQKEAELASAYEHISTRCDVLLLSRNDIYLEKFIDRARHVEVPVIRDHVGNVLVLPEIDSSIQVRFQKLVSESPSPLRNHGLLKSLATTSRKLIEKLDYVGYATVEFLISGKEEPLFLEINGYIQPSHIATNQLTGIDIIKEQIRVLAGETLQISQEDIRPRGHAINVSINAEDPEDEFSPGFGTIKRMDLLSGMGSPVYGTLRSGEQISSFYAPVIAQAVFIERSRIEAINKMNIALESYIIEGIKTNLPFLRALGRSDDFRKRNIDSGYLNEKNKLSEMLDSIGSPEEADIAALLAALALQNEPATQHILDEAQRVANYSIWNFASRLLNRNSMEFKS